MKFTAIISLLALTLLGTTALAQQEKPASTPASTKAQEQKRAPIPSPRPTPAGEPAFGQDKKPCPCDIVGTWKAQISKTEARLYEFDSAGVLKVLKVSADGKPREIATAKYEFVEEPLDDESAMPEHQHDQAKQISLTATGKNRIFGRTQTTMKVASFDDSSITCEIPGIAGRVRWTRIDPDRYFIVLVARQNEFYDNSGPAFPMVIKLAGGISQVDAAGIYSDHGKAAFGTVPPATYKDYLREARSDSEVILRLEINSRQYERALKVVQEWQRRVREHALLYSESPVSLNNVLLVKAVTETLNLCQNDFDLYKLDYSYPRDWITNDYSPEFVPFFFFKELRRRNEARHIEYNKFQQLVPMANLASR
ncbi:MAG TPA: hypothetical protein VEV42_16880 [Pyrinomonadaceae bacterium]|nr:hypothetical protein [Pyrinomonadaceae bacterium]